MNQLLLKYQQNINKLPPEAKAIILAMILGLVFIIWYYGFGQNLLTNISQTTAAIKTIELAIPSLETQLKNVKEAYEDQLAQILKAQKESTQIISAASSQLISPQTMVKILQDLLTTRYRMILLELKNPPVKEITLPTINLTIFEYDIIMKFQGDYFSTMAYLQAIEKLGWKIFWDKLAYRVVQYPTAEITLQIHTFSDQRG